MVSKNFSETLNKLDYGDYKNTKEVVLGGVKYSARDLFVKAPLISSLNMYFVGGTGEGKTQLANDLVSYFGDDSCYTMGRNDFEPSDLMKQINWDLFQELKKGNVSQGKLETISKNINKVLFYVDEFNRCKPIVQNYFFDFFDGKFVFDGIVYKLGKSNYSVGFASGNLGNGDYVGISDSDRAMKDRMHMIVSFDDVNFRPKEIDAFNIYSGNKKNPRATIPSLQQKLTDEIINMHKEFQERNLNALYPIIGIYLSEGLDYLSKTKRNSKRAIESAWKHSNIDGVNTKNLEGQIFPLSKRAILSSQALATSLEMIAESKGLEVKNKLDLFLDSLKLTIPYSGVLHPIYVEQEHLGDVYSAFDEVFEKIKKEVKDREEVLHLSLAHSEAGMDISSEIYKDILNGSENWRGVVNFIKENSDYRKKNPSEAGKKLKKVLMELN
jgi:hypothetical protein